MIVAMWIGIAFALLAGGVGMTFLLGSLLPAEFSQRVQEHGRFAGLGASVSDEVAGKRTKARAPKLGTRTADAV